MEKEKPNYYGILPANVRYAKIPAMAKILYSELSALTNSHGFCYATNRYFAELYDMSPTRISHLFGILKQNAFIDIEIIRNEKNEVIQRRIYLYQKNAIPEAKKDVQPVAKNRNMNITSNLNNINKNKIPISNEIDADFDKNHIKKEDTFNVKNVIDIFNNAYLENEINISKVKPDISAKEANQAKNLARICVSRSPDNPSRFCEELVKIAFLDKWFQTHASIANFVSQINFFLPHLPQPEFKSPERERAEQEENRKLNKLLKHFCDIDRFKEFNALYKLEGKEGVLRLYEKTFGK